MTGVSHSPVERPAAPDQTSPVMGQPSYDLILAGILDEIATLKEHISDPNGVYDAFLAEMQKHTRQARRINEQLNEHRKDTIRDYKFLLGNQKPFRFEWWWDTLFRAMVVIGAILTVMGLVKLFPAGSDAEPELPAVYEDITHYEVGPQHSSQHWYDDKRAKGWVLR